MLFPKMATTNTSHVEMDLSKEVKAMIDKYPCLSINEEKGKIQCRLSGHEMPCKSDALTSYINGKKFKKLLALNQYSYDKYREHLVPSIKKGRQHQLFCKITERHLNNKPEHIQKHIEGRRFQKAFKRWEDCQKTGTKFVANPGRRRKLAETDMEEDFDDEADNDSDADSLSDLYPDQQFAEVDDSDEEDDDSDVTDDESGEKKVNGNDSDFDFDDMDSEGQSSSKSPIKSSSKHKPSVSVAENPNRKDRKQQAGNKRKSAESSKQHKKMRT